MEDKMTDAQKEAPIRIDYDNVDVADIMNQIKRRIAQRPPVPAGAPAATGEGPSGVVPAAPGGGEGLAMRAIRMLIRPFMPIVRPLLDRFIIRVNIDVNVRLDQMNDSLNMRIDEMSGRIDTVSGKLKMQIDEVSDKLDMRIDQVSDRLNIRIDEVSDKLIMRIDKLSDGFNTARENTRLLHTLAHNLVLELTKLRIEYETLKSKMRIMEKDFEVLGKREKVLEKKVIE